MTDEEILASRDKAYGTFRKNGDCTAMAWTAILRATDPYGGKMLDAHDVGLMMATHKIIRAALAPTYDPDHYQDARNYLTLAQKEKEREHGRTS